MTFRQARVSEPSDSVDDINIPEVSNIVTKFVYNYFLKNERVSEIPYEDPNVNLESLSLDKTARYITVSWIKPSISFSTSTTQGLSSEFLKNNSGKIVSEDNFFNTGYYNHVFSNLSSIEQGASDLEIYSRLSNYDTESMSMMSRYQVKNVSSEQQDDTKNYKELSSLSSAYSFLSDLPKTAMGLSVYDNNGILSDKGDLTRSLYNSVSLNAKINGAIVSDLFKTTTFPTTNHEETARRVAASAVSGVQSIQGSFVPILVDTPGGETIDDVVKIVGYEVQKYLYQDGSFYIKDTFYLGGPNNTSIIDKKVSYGKTYVYSIRAIASVKMYLYDVSPSRETTVRKCEVLVSSKPKSSGIETYEFLPPPEPQGLKFFFNYSKRQLKIKWDEPINSQRDIKQYQVLRRESINHPFELIAQYGFDDSLSTQGKNYKTLEVVDANDYQSMRPELKYLVKQQSGLPVNEHIDFDFTVDDEFFVSSDYIYTVCSVDAHGMISNYSEQHRVTFDSFKNKLVNTVICDSGCPRQYPNLKLNADAFKDVISTSGDNTRQVSVYFTPEYLKLKDNRGITFSVVEAQTPSNKNSYYLIQFINLDNQKMQTLKINIEDPASLTTRT